MDLITGIHCISGGEGSLWIESDVEILSERPLLSERAVAPFPNPIAAAISFWHDGRVHVCGGHSTYPAEDPDMDSIQVQKKLLFFTMPLRVQHSQFATKTQLRMVHVASNPELTAGKTKPTSSVKYSKLSQISSQICVSLISRIIHYSDT